MEVNVSIGGGQKMTLSGAVLRRSPEVTRLCFLRMTHWAVRAFCEWPISRAKRPPNNKTTFDKQIGIIISSCPTICWNPERDQNALVNR